jgi:hypothetical protein
VSWYGGVEELPPAVPNGNNFLDHMTPYGSPWVIRHNYQNGDVWDIDFVDSTLFPWPAGNDDHNFDDSSNAAISYYTGHGANTWNECRHYLPGMGSMVIPCSHSSECAQYVQPGWPMFQSLPAKCRSSPALVQQGYPGICCFVTNEEGIVVDGSYSHWGNYVQFRPGGLKWGESPTSGGWAGAGTNGGTNLVVLDMSHPVHPPYFWEHLGALTAGVHLIAATAPYVFSGRMTTSCWSHGCEVWVPTLSG